MTAEKGKGRHEEQGPRTPSRGMRPEGDGSPSERIWGGPGAHFHKPQPKHLYHRCSRSLVRETPKSHKQGVLCGQRTEATLSQHRTYSTNTETPHQDTDRAPTEPASHSQPPAPQADTWWGTVPLASDTPRRPNQPSTTSCVFLGAPTGDA